MPTVDQALGVYQELAALCDRQGQPQMHDRFLVLAADAAFGAGRIAEAERVRLALLHRNPHHLLRPYGSFGEAMNSPDVQSYVLALRRSHPFEASEQLLQSLRKGAGEPAYADEPAEPSTAVAEDMNWSIDPDALKGPEPLKVFRAPEPAEVLRPRIASPDIKQPTTKKRAVEPPEDAKPKPVAPWQAPPPKPGGRSDGAGPRPAVWQVPPTMPAPDVKKAPVAPPPAYTPPAPTKPAAALRAPIPPRPTRDVYPLLPEPAGSRGYSTTEGDESERGGGYWLSLGLFVMLLAAGLSLAVYTLGRPFWPQP